MAMEHDPLIEYFIENRLPPEIRTLVTDLFETFTILDYQDYEDKYIELIALEETMDSNAMLDGFIQRLLEDINYVLDQHRIKVRDDLDIDTRVRLIKSLTQLNYLEDWSVVISTLMNQEYSDIEKLAYIIDQTGYCTMDEVVASIDEMDDTVLTALEEYMHEYITIRNDLDTDWEERVEQKKDTIKALAWMYEGYPYVPLGLELITRHIPPALNIDYYLSMVDIKEYINTDKIDITADHVFTLIMISDSNDILKTYQSISDILFDKLSDIQKLEPLLISLFNKYQELMRDKPWTN